MPSNNGSLTWVLGRFGPIVSNFLETMGQEDEAVSANSYSNLDLLFLECSFPNNDSTRGLPSEDQSSLYLWSQNHATVASFPWFDSTLHPVRHENLVSSGEASNLLGLAVR